MKPLQLEDRTPNWETHSRTPAAHCRVCDDNGWAEATTRTDTYNGISAIIEEMAPCPFCVRGYRQEFPDIPAGEKGREWVKPPWGEDGYWQGRDLPDHLIEQFVAGQQPQRQLSQREQLAAIRSLSHSVLGTIDREIEPHPGTTR